MAYVRSSAAKGTGRRTGGHRRRRHSVSLSKVRWQPGTARNQKKQIYNNRKEIAQLKKRTERHWVYTDYQLTTAPVATNDTFYAYRLLDFAAMRPVMRQDVVVQNGSHTFIKRCQINWRVMLNDSPTCYLNLFVVTPRREVGSRSFVTNPMVLDDDYIENPMQAGTLIRLNPAVVKVHFAKYATMSRSALNRGFTVGQNAGDPLTTWRKGQINMDLNIPVTIPTMSTGISNWRQKDPNELPYYHRYQVLLFMSWDVPPPPLTAAPQFFMDTLFTCVNSD